MIAECGHDAIEMRMIDSEPLDDCHTRHTFKCRICGNTEQIIEKHERITGLDECGWQSEEGFG